MNNQSEIQNLNEIENLLKNSGISITDLHNTDTLTNEYQDYIKDIDKKKINLGFPLLDENIRGLRVQELLTIVAGTGIGKSALALNFLLNFVKNTNELTVLFSLEMSTIGIAERIFQIELDKFGFDIEKKFIKNDKLFIDECRQLKKSLNNFLIITNRVEIHKIPDIIKAVELIKEKKVRLIAIDYIGLMENSLFPKDEYLRISDNMKKLYSYAKELDCAIINLSQTSRIDVKGNNNGLSLYSGKGSGELENSSDFLLTLDRVDAAGKGEEFRYIHIQELNNNSDVKFDLIRLTIQKNRRGKRGILYLTFNRKNLRIIEYNDIEIKTTKEITF